jgi:hypothetical protein
MRANESRRQASVNVSVYRGHSAATDTVSQSVFQSSLATPMKAPNTKFIRACMEWIEDCLGWVTDESSSQVMNRMMTLHLHASTASLSFGRQFSVINIKKAHFVGKRVPLRQLIHLWKRVIVPFAQGMWLPCLS